MWAKTLPSAAQLALSLLFLLSSLEKARTVRSRSAAWHPVLVRTRWTRHRAPLLMGVFAALDCACAFLVVLVPRIGGLWATGLLLIYTWVSRGRPAGEGCRCFFRIMDTRSFPGLLTRNGALFLMIIVILLSNPIPSWTGAPLAVALLALLWTIATGVDALSTAAGGAGRAILRNEPQSSGSP